MDLEEVFSLFYFFPPRDLTALQHLSVTRGIFLERGIPIVAHNKSAVFFIRNMLAHALTNLLTSLNETGKAQKIVGSSTKLRETVKNCEHDESQ